MVLSNIQAERVDLTDITTSDKMKLALTSVTRAQQCSASTQMAGPVTGLHMSRVKNEASALRAQFARSQNTSSATGHQIRMTQLVRDLLEATASRNMMTRSRTRTLLARRLLPEQTKSTDTHGSKSLREWPM